MSTPYICDKCEAIEEHDTGEFSRQCKCGGIMMINYTDNYEMDTEHTPCNGCLYLRIGNGEKCNYCDRI